MKALPRIACSIVLLAGLLNGAGAAQRTFVASFGNDANACSITSPCRSFTRALTQTDANGEIIALDSAGYGAVIVNKSVSIVAPEGIYAGISVFAGQSGVTVNAGAGARVVLRGLAINGQGGDFGIVVGSAGDVLIDRCLVSNMGTDSLDAGIWVTAAGSRVVIESTAIVGGVGYGLLVNADATVTVQGSRIAVRGGSGIRVTTPSARLGVTDSALVRNEGNGIEASGGPGGTLVVAISRTLLEGHPGAGVIAGLSAGTQLLTVADSDFRNNEYGIRLLAFEGETITATATGNVVANSSQAGISASGEGASVVASRNVVTRNGAGGLVQASGAQFRSFTSNAVENNPGGDTVGSITTVTPR